MSYQLTKDDVLGFIKMMSSMSESDIEAKKKAQADLTKEQRDAHMIRDGGSLDKFAKVRSHVPLTPPRVRRPAAAAATTCEPRRARVECVCTARTGPSSPPRA